MSRPNPRLSDRRPACPLHGQRRALGIAAGPGEQRVDSGTGRSSPQYPLTTNTRQVSPTSLYFSLAEAPNPIRRGRTDRSRLTSTIHHQNWQLIEAYQAGIDRLEWLLLPVSAPQCDSTSRDHAA